MDFQCHIYHVKYVSLGLFLGFLLFSPLCGICVLYSGPRITLLKL